MRKKVFPLILLFIELLMPFPSLAQEKQNLELYLETGHRATSAFFSPNGENIVTSGLLETLKLWDVRSGRELDTIKGFQEVAVSPDEKTIALLASNHVTLWDVASWQKRITRIQI